MKEKQITIFHNNIYNIEADLKSTGKYIQHHSLRCLRQWGCVRERCDRFNQYSH